MSPKFPTVSGSLKATYEQGWNVSLSPGRVDFAISDDTIKFFSGIQGDIRMNIADLDIADQPIEIVDANTGEILFANKFLKEIRPNEPHRACFDINAGGEQCLACPLGKRIMKEVRAKTLILLGDHLYEVSHLPIHYKGKEAFIQYYYDKTEEENKKRLLESIIENTPAGFLMADLDFCLTQANDSLANMLGYSKEELSKMSLFDLASDKSKKVLEEQKSQRDTKQKRTYTLKLKRKDGKYIYVNVNATTVYDVNNKVIGSFAVIADITEERQTRKRLEDAVAEHAILFEQANSPIIKIEGTRVSAVNEQFTKVFGYSLEDMIDINKLEQCFIDQENKDKFQELLKKVAQDQSAIAELKAIHKDGSIVDIRVNVFYAKRGKKRIAYAIMEDITQRKELEKRLEHLAVTDGLTDVPNRRRLDEVLSIEFNRSKRNGEPLACLMIDADKFKDINDLLSHADGDTTLQRIANCLSESVRTPAGDFVGRYGGEEFTILLPNCNLEEALTTAERIRNAVKEMKLIHPTRGVVSVSIGIAMISENMTSSNQLMETADQALTNAKKNGRDRAEVAEFQNPL